MKENRRLIAPKEEELIRRIQFMMDHELSERLAGKVGECQHSDIPCSG